MKPIEGYELVNEAGEFKHLPAGIYGVKITNVVDVPEKEYWEVYCDITKGEYANYFKTLVDAGLRDTSKSIRSYKTNALPFFKAFITSIEKTNPGYHWDWNEKGLIGKNVIAVFGEEEYKDSEGNVKIRTRLEEFRSLEAYQQGKIKVPELKKLPVEEEIDEEDVLPEVVDFNDLPF
jgi:hypothetical protein